MAKGIAHREWRIDRDDFHDSLGRVDEAAFRAAVQNELALAEHICERLGVALVAAPIRTRDLNDGAWLTVGWVFKTATVPGATTPASETQALEDALAEPALVNEPDAMAEVE